jgi:phospho-N-acetylmuramoyl-pentapeptide-transferase
LFYELYPYLEDWFSAFRVFRYITFRSAYALVSALLISFMMGPWLIGKLRQWHLGETIRDDGPASHKAKEGTPSMGGLLILTSILVPTLLWADLSNRYVQLVLAVTVWTGAIGFLDDYLKLVKKKSKGLVGRYKMTGQLLFGLVLGAFLYFFPLESSLGVATEIPFFKGALLELGIFYLILVVLVVAGTSNAVNLTDGLDGLAIGVNAFVFFAFTALAYLSGHKNFSEYLHILYLPGASELTIYCASVVGASLGFLWFNAHPAEVFMGDTGSLSLGGALGTVAILLKKELLLVIIGGVFVLEALSVILQVGSFKLRGGKRIFKMAPLHHHFELKGWAESKVVVRFWILSALFALIALSTLKLR